MLFFNFDKPVFVVATSFVPFFFHTAGAALFCSETIQVPAYQLIHAVMQLNGRPGRGKKIDEKEYGSDETFHPKAKVMNTSEADNELSHVQ